MPDSHALRSAPPPGMPRWYALAAASVLVVVLAIVATGRMHHDDDAARVPVQVTDAPSHSPARPYGRQGAAPAVPSENRTERGPAALPAQSPARTAFARSDDLFAYAQQLSPAVQQGDAEASWLLSRVVDTCAGYAADPAAHARDTALMAGSTVSGASTTLRAARERVAHRCRRFAPSDGLSTPRALALRRQAADAGSLVAEAELLGQGEPLHGDADYARDLVARVRNSLDADAFRALSPAMGDVAGAGMQVLRQADVAPRYRELVWQLAACRLGMDCGPGSPLMTAYCANGGICSREPEQGFEAFAYDAAIPRQDADVVTGMVDMLVSGKGEDE